MRTNAAKLEHLRSKRGLIVLALAIALAIGALAGEPWSEIAFAIAIGLALALLLMISIRLTSLNTRVGRLERSGRMQPSGVSQTVTKDSPVVSVRASGTVPSEELVEPPSASISAARAEEPTGTPYSALAKWVQAHEDDPDNVEAVVGMARNLEKLARFQEAVTTLEHGPASARTSVGGMIVAGRALEKMGKFQESIESWNGVLERRPDHAEAIRSLAAVEARIESGVIGRELDLSRPEDMAIVDLIRGALLRAAAEGGGSPPDDEYLNRHSYMRYNRSIGNLLPWIGRHLDFPTAEVIEVGCGTGSTLIGLGMNALHAHGYDIDPIVLDSCAARARAFGLANVTLHLSPADQIQAEMARNHRDGVDAILLYAVLEHLTPSERLEAISNTWDLIRPGGLLIVVEAPNRFNYFDWHSAQLPFFHQLPRELQRLYFDRSPRKPFVDAMSHALASGGQDSLDEALTRFGQSVSYHEFELALGRLDDLVVDDGDHPLVDRVFTSNELIGEDALRRFLTEWGFSIPRGFDRANINVILRKPPSGH